MGGRGAGKTRAGAEWVRALATNNEEFAGRTRAASRWSARHWHDAREVMIEGESGLLRVHPRASGRSGSRRGGGLWPNGAEAQAFSADDPEQPARAAVRRRLVRRARQVAARRRRLRHAAVRLRLGARSRGR
jgi:phage terminase large subunit-like protein